MSNDKDDSKFGERTIVSPIASIAPFSAEQAPALLVIAGPQIGRNFAIDKEEYMIGRVENCDFIVEDDLVSRHHCKIIVNQAGATLIDLASTNGTFLNGHRIEKGPLKEGDRIQVGSSTILKYHLQEEVEVKFLTELYDAATKDFLTGVYNKKYFMDRLTSEFFYVQRNGGQIAIIILDLDFFKKVNDTYGHVAGDATLKKLAHHLMHNTRKHDMVARFGGEEFMIFMRECDLDQAKALAEHLREGVSKLVIEAGHKTFNVTASFGISTINEQTRENIASVEAFIEAADANLYRAKKEGRNRICF